MLLNLPCLRRQILLEKVYRPRPGIFRRLGMITIGVGIVVERMFRAGVDFDVQTLAGLRQRSFERLDARHNVGIIFSVITHDGARNVRHGFQGIGIPAVVNHRGIEVFTFGGEV